MTIKKLYPDISSEDLGKSMAASYVFLKTIWRVILAKKEASGSSFMRKKIGIVVVNKSGKPLGTVQNFFRGLFRAFPFNLFTIAHMEYTKSDRGIHDKIFGSYVLRLNEHVDEFQISAFIKNNFK